MSGHPYKYTDRELIHRIERSAGQRAGYKQLIRELGLGGGRERRLLLEQLARITARGALVKIDHDHWSLPSAAPAKTARPQRTTVAEQHPTRDRLVAGRIDMHRDGYAFVRPNGSGDREQDLFIPPNELNGAMQGDEVLVDEAPRDREGRRSGRVARVLTRRNPTVVGIFHYARSHRRSPWEDLPLAKGNYVTPFDERMTQPILIVEGDEIVAESAATPHRVLGEEAQEQKRLWTAAENPNTPLEGLAVDVEITGFPSLGRPARGRVIEVLGPPDAFGVDVEIVIRKHHLPHTFPTNVLAEAADSAKQTVDALDADEIARRRDFRGLPIVTIDGETARDFDDAVYVEPLPNGNWQLQVHIADVSYYVRPGTALDLEARLRGTSVYFPDRAIPMLPNELSSGMCSLRPDEDRLVQSCLMEIDTRGEVVGFEVCEGIIRSARRMTYTQVQAIIDGDQEIRSQFAELTPEFERMHELALKLNAKRKHRGSLDFDLPEPVVLFDPDGNMQSIVRSERGWSHRLIEEFMLAANECVAHWIEAQGIPGIYRIHETPDPKRIVEFEETAAQFGYTLGFSNLPVKRVTTRGDRRDTRNSGRRTQTHEIPDAIPVTPQMYQRLTAKIQGKPEERILSYLMLRSLKQARYSETNVGHFALASPSYTHFTSPIRRYPDLIVHRLLRYLLQAGANPNGFAIPSTEPQPWGENAIARPNMKQKGEHEGPLPEDELNAIAAESSQAERRADDAERELIEWKKIRFMQDRVGEDFRGIILSCTKYGFFVELDELFIEGMVPIASLQDDRYFFRDTDRTIVGGRNGRVFKIGDRVHVLLDRIDRQQQRLQFALMPSEYEATGSSRSLRKSNKGPKEYGEALTKKGKKKAKPRKIKNRNAKGRRR
ncbi:ribonuclease R family protein [Edaphobacter albus]|uniref:ribonuclease R family protein n=1 Tax=Edaphobacter sp. 4G125 TaxID=2763071 RepID=UPI001648EC2F|nr:VacB/RNase II family 3'-5' exoribonuclease [Edaphobacter sp. 4G125]QNI36636.1 VacB/RNase II family 3'-5' exoribonuclease [Edaphobacter sp. 4G125]